MARVTARSIPATLASLARADGSRPLLTFYDDATDERAELSVTSFANWVAKTANLVRDGLCAQPGDRVAVALPAHWQGAVWLCAAWSCGLVVTFDEPALADADYAVVGPDTAVPASRAANSTVAVPLLPLGAPAADPVAGALDFAAEVLAYPDEFSPGPDVTADTPALAGTDGTLTHAQLIERGLAVAAGLRLGAVPRLLTDANPCSFDGCGTALLAPLVTGGAVVLVRNIDLSRVAARVAQERVTARSIGSAGAG